MYTNVCACVSMCVPVSGVDGCFCVSGALYVCVFSEYNLCASVCLPRLTEEKKGLSSETEMIRAKLI